MISLDTPPLNDLSIPVLPIDDNCHSEITNKRMAIIPMDWFILYR